MSFVAIPNARLPTNFLFKARASLQTVLQSLRQNVKKLAQLRNNPNYPSVTGDLVLHGLYESHAYAYLDMKMDLINFFNSQAWFLLPDIEIH